MSFSNSPKRFTYIQIQKLQTGDTFVNKFYEIKETFYWFNNIYLIKGLNNLDFKDGFDMNDPSYNELSLVS